MTKELITFDTLAPGKPATITEAGCRRLTKDRANGLSQASCASRLGISASTLRRIMDDDEEAKAAYDTGTGAMQDELVGLLMKHARDGDRTSAIFLLKGACGFREIGPTDGSSASAPTVNITLPPPMSADQMQAQLAAMRDVTPPQAEQPSAKPLPKGLTRQ